MGGFFTFWAILAHSAPALDQPSAFFGKLFDPIGGADNVLQVLTNIFKILGSLQTPDVNFSKSNLTIQLFGLVYGK